MDNDDKIRVLSKREQALKLANQLTDSIREISPNLPVEVDKFKKYILPTVIDLRDGKEVDRVAWINMVGHPKIGIDVVDGDGKKILELPPLFGDVDVRQSSESISTTLSNLERIRQFQGINGDTVHLNCYDRVKPENGQVEKGMLSNIYMVNKILEYFGEDQCVLSESIKGKYDEYVKNNHREETPSNVSDDANGDDTIFEEELL